MPVNCKIMIMRIDLKRQKAKSSKRTGLNDRHVIGCTDAFSGNISTGTPSYISCSALYLIPNQVKQIKTINIMQQLKCISSSNYDNTVSYTHLRAHETPE